MKSANMSNCEKKLVSNRNLGLLLFLGIVVGYLWKERRDTSANKFENNECAAGCIVLIFNSNYSVTQYGL